MFKKIIMTILVFYGPLIAYPQNWIKVAKTKELEFYVDSSSIKYNGYQRRFWLTADYFQRDYRGDLSFRSYQEVDCNEEKLRHLQLQTYTDHMGTGQLSAAVAGLKVESQWTYAPPGSGILNVIKYVCNK